MMDDMGGVLYSSEGYVDLQGHRMWYGIAGTGEMPDVVPLLLIHGGPGLPHDYLEPLVDLTSTGRRVIFYDQLGCGNSDRLDDPTAYTPDLFVDELAAIRHALGLERVHLHAHSYGGVTALNYMLTQPSGVLSLTLADTFSSVPALVAGWHSLLAPLPAVVQQTILDYQERGIRDDQEAEEAFQTYFVRRHVLRGPMTPGLARTFQKMGGEVYATMHGPRWLQATGAYGDWDVTERLQDISVPTLVVCGRDDQCIPALSQTVHTRIMGSRLHVFEQSAHLPFLEEPDSYRQILTSFLQEAEAQPSTTL